MPRGMVAAEELGEYGAGVSWLTLADGTHVSIRGPQARAWARVIAEGIERAPEPHMGQPITWADDARISADGP